MSLRASFQRLEKLWNDYGTSGNQNILNYRERKEKTLENKEIIPNRKM